ncbi:deoxyribonuclease IV [Pseudactinotalea terrae]|uniref:deoxyribonuclease IV n=1 Tax=Pseudactinotalea terrae TaxID=1743262 RepID=UPI0012E1FD79|nr:deoxyribonuclease IV [Pseudactinotalea terrae]
MRIGSHVESEDPIAGAKARGADVAQIFLGAPQAWKDPEVLYPGGARALREAAAEADLQLVVHAPYRINVASTNNRIRIPSRTLLQKQVNAAAEIGAIGLVVHGGHVGADDALEVGFDNWRKCLEKLERPTAVLIENTAGGEGAMARGVDRIAALWEAVRAAGEENVGFCLDTCHAFASGEPLVGLVDRITAATGRVDVVHVNDSRDPFGSNADRHANLGQGHILADDLLAVIRDADAPSLVETPGAYLEQGTDIAWLRERL